MQPSAEIARAECAKRRRECDLSGARATLCGDRACRVREMQARVRFVRCPRDPLRRSCVSSARNAGESAICPVPAQPSAEIVRVECAKCRRECEVSGPRATLCGDRACRVCEMQARVRFVRCPRDPLRRSCVSSARNAGESAICPVPRATLCGDRACRVCEMQARVRSVRSARNPLRRSCVSSARNAGESAICPVPAQPSAESARNAGESAKCPVRAQSSAEIVRVECAKCKPECDLSGSGATLCGDRACRVREMQARMRFGDLPLHFWRKSRAKRSLWRLAASLLEEEVSCENARFGDLPLHVWRKSRAKRAFWRLGASLLAGASYETFVLETCRVTLWGSLVRNESWRCTGGAGLRQM